MLLFRQFGVAVCVVVEATAVRRLNCATDVVDKGLLKGNPRIDSNKIMVLLYIDS